jgi:C-terminal peptidase prc
VRRILALALILVFSFTAILPASGAEATLAFSRAVAQSQKATALELERWLKSYEQAIDYAFHHNWLTRAITKRQILSASVERLANYIGEPMPVLTGDVNRDVALALNFLRKALAARPEGEWDDIFREAVLGLVRLWDRYAVTLTPLDVQILMLQLGFYDEGDGVFLERDEKTGKYFVFEIIPDMGGAKAGLRLGDEVVAIDGVPLSGALDENTIWKINRNARRRGFMIYRVKRNELILELKVEYLRRAVPKVKHRLLDSSIGLIEIKEFDIYTGYEVEDALLDFMSKGVKSLILDLRSNEGGAPSGLQLSLSFFMSGPLYARRSRNGDTIKVETKAALAVENVFPGPVALLVNAKSASAAEVMAFVMKRRPKTRLFGEDTSLTFGKGVGQAGHELANGWYFHFTVNEIIDLDGKTYDGKGVQVDETVSSSRPGGDATLERAFAWLKSLQ